MRQRAGVDARAAIVGARARRPLSENAPPTPAVRRLALQDVIYEVVASSGGVGPDSGGGAGLEAKDEGPPVEARARADVRLPTRSTSRARRPRAARAASSAAATATAWRRTRTRAMGTVGRMSCAHLAVGERAARPRRAASEPDSVARRGAEGSRRPNPPRAQVQPRGERDALALRAARGRPSAVDCSSACCAVAANDGLRAR